ncbi:MAG: hypothetical protein K0S56_2136 [Microvirga sp.]|jgi:hypothetical protein|nr:hypothetical protein [Microvirga sp.]
MNRLPAAIVALFLTLPAAAAAADGGSLSGTLWHCSRASDQSRFVMVFHADGGVGGGEIHNGAVSPYLFDTSRAQAGRWPGSWDEREDRFRWTFPDQNLGITGRIDSSGRTMRLIGSEQNADDTAAIACRRLRRLPPIGGGFVIPTDGHFMNAGSGEGILKVPARSSLP